MNRSCLGYAHLKCTVQCRSFFTPATVLLYPRIRPNGGSSKAVLESLPQPRLTNDRSEGETSTISSVIEETRSDSEPATKIMPWFMEYNKQFEEQFPLDRREAEPIPEIPKGSPPVLLSLAKYMTQDLVLKDLSLLDLRNRENPWGDNTIMVVCTARSERQLRSSADSLKGFLRKLGFNPQVEGLVNWENTKVKRRRRRKMIGRANYQIEDDRLNWLFLEVGGSSGLILQLFSEDGRREYALEELWQGRANNQVVLPPKLRDVPMLDQESRPLITTSSSSNSVLGPLSRRLFSTASRPRHTVFAQR